MSGPRYAFRRELHLKLVDVGVGIDTITNGK